MKHAVILEGTIDEAGMLHVDTPVELPAGKVRVIVEPEEPINENCPESWIDVVLSSPYSRPEEELAAELKALRDEWDRPILR
jgi:uncharacterized membrane protein